MIVHRKPSLLQLLCLYRLSVVPRVAPQLLAVVLASTLVTVVGHRFPAHFRTLSVAPFTLLGIAISIFLGFRNNACYDRWWEGRRQLGTLVGELRSLARITTTLPTKDHDRRTRIVLQTIAYTYALMAHLRAQPTPTEVARYAPDPLPTGTRNLPDTLLRSIAAELGAMLADREIGEQLYLRFDDRLVASAGIQAACERILSTPTPFSYTLLLHRTAYAFCFLLPFGLVGTFGYATPLFCTLVAYAFFGLDQLGDELELPFGPNLNCLPLSAMARTIEISLLESLHQPTPDPLQPIHSILR